MGIGAAGAAAVPLLGVSGPVGVLSVLTARPGEPDEAQRSLLRAVVAWAGARLEGLPGTPPGPGSATGTERAVRMGEPTAALSEAATSQDVVRAVADHVLPPFGADGLVLQVLEAGRLHVVGSAGYPQEFLRLVDGVPLETNVTVKDVVRTRTPRFIESRAEIYRRYPSLRQLNERSPKEAWAFLPMVASGRTTGLCVVSFSEPRSFSARAAARRPSVPYGPPLVRPAEPGVPGGATVAGPDGLSGTVRRPGRCVRRAPYGRAGRGWRGARRSGRRGAG